MPFIIDNKFGENPDIDTATVPEDIWIAGGEYPFPAVARQLTVRSTSSNDDGDPQGIGAGSVEAVYLDNAFNEYTVGVTLDGTTLVNIGSALAYRINRAYVVIAGGSTNVGTLLFEAGGTVIARIDPNEGQTLQAVYTVPTNYKYGELRRFTVNLGKQTVAAYARVELQFRPNNGAWRTQDVIYPQATGNSETRTIYDAGVGPRFPVGADVRVRCTSVSANDILITTKFSIAKKTGADIVTGS